MPTMLQLHKGMIGEWLLLTCFLEYGPEAVNVHDVLQERAGLAWQLRVSAYRKLRISPDWLASALEAEDFSVDAGVGPSGMVRVIATKR